MMNISNTKKRFKKVYIEITNVCNLSCPFCAKCGREARFMTEDEFVRAAEQTKTVSDYVYFHLLGEPTLHPLMRRFLDICTDIGLKVNLTTNGTLPDNIPAEHSALRKVSISLHAAEANSLDVKGYAVGVKSLVEKLAENGKITELKFWNGTYDKNIREDSYTGRLMALLSPLPESVHIGCGETFVWPADSKEDFNPIFCMGLRDQCAVLSDGTVVPCCLDSEGEIALGNVFCTSLADILSSPRAKALYDGFSAGKATESLCRRCSFYQNRKTKFSR